MAQSDSTTAANVIDLAAYRARRIPKIKGLPRMLRTELASFAGSSPAPANLLPPTIMVL